mmetsp:Transcript_19220/g.41317  ORF Transcript_19220/g.41317 Transcript_19220/m.41317 type:complete len:103 (+) Transcript_19220:1850-2158(+)
MAGTGKRVARRIGVTVVASSSNIPVNCITYRSLVQDLAKAVRSTSAQTDFDEGMKDIFDYQDYVNETSELERKIDIQRRLFPYRGSKFAYLRRKKSSSDSAQ